MRIQKYLSKVMTKGMFRKLTSGEDEEIFKWYQAEMQAVQDKLGSTDTKESTTDESVTKSP
jgi:hypothetical protein